VSLGAGALTVPMIVCVTTGADALRSRREAVGMSQEELAIAVGVSPGMVSQWETGKAAPRRPKAMRIDESLGAAGAVLDAFGYGTPAGVEDQIVALTERVRQQGELIEALAAEISQLRRQVGQ